MYVYILLTNTGTLFTKSIKTYTRAPYNHASLAFDKELQEVYSFGRKKPHNPLNGGFVKEDILDGTYKRYPETTCVLYELEVTERQVEKMRRLLNVFKKNNKKMTYNIFGVLSIPLDVPFEVSTAYFCSQFVSEILHRSGVQLWNKLPALVTPNDFRESDKLKVVYEGRLFDYEPIRMKLS